MHRGHAAWQHFDDADWAAARDAFAAALEQDPADPEALDGPDSTGPRNSVLLKGLYG